MVTDDQLLQRKVLSCTCGVLPGHDPESVLVSFTIFMKVKISQSNYFFL